jgi:hypothetical protein
VWSRTRRALLVQSGNLSRNRALQAWRMDRNVDKGGMGYSDTVQGSTNGYLHKNNLVPLSPSP